MPQQDGFFPPLPVSAKPREDGSLPPLPRGGATPPPIVTLPSDLLSSAVPIANVIPEPVTTTAIDPTLDYVGFQGDFTYDSAVVSFSPPFVQAAGLTAANWTVSATIINSGPGTIRTLRVSASSNDSTPLNGAGTLFELMMLRVSSNTGDNTSLVWRPVPDSFRFINSTQGQYAPVQMNGAVSINLTISLPTQTISTTVAISINLLCRRCK